MPSADNDKVVAALRLGWAVAEMRGRLRPDAPQDPNRPHWDRPFRALPLMNERSEAELIIEVECIVEKVSSALGFTPLVQGQAAGAQATTLIQAIKSTAPDEWNVLSELIYELDANLQDNITSLGEASSSAYQAGRGLADLYWSLDPTAADNDLTSWKALFGPDRLTQIDRSLGRIASYLDPLTTPGISGTLQAWAAVAGDTAWRAKSEAELREQIRRFYSLLIANQDPQSYVKPFDAIRHLRTTIRIAGAFWFQLALLAIGLGAASWLGYLVSQGGGSATGKTILGLAGGLGVSAAAIQTRIKNTTQALTKRLKAMVYADLIVMGLAIVPPKPVSRSVTSRSGARAANRVVRVAAANRGLNPIVTSPVT